MTVTEALIAARALISDPENWCQGVPKSGCRRCSLEAISTACGSNDELFRACHRRLSRAMGALMVSKFNDENDHATVMAAWDKAIAEEQKP